MTLSDVTHRYMSIEIADMYFLCNTAMYECLSMASIFVFEVGLSSDLNITASFLAKFLQDPCQQHT